MASLAHPATFLARTDVAVEHGLLVTADVELGAFLNGLLYADGSGLRTIADAETAVALTLRLKIDTVFIDIHFAGPGSGLKLGHRLKQAAPQTDVCLLISRADVAHDRMLDQIGAHDFEGFMILVRPEPKAALKPGGERKLH